MAVKTRILAWIVQGAIEKDGIRRKMAVRWINEKLEETMKSKETTIAGICAILMAIVAAVTLLVDGNANTNPDYTVTIAAISAGIGLLRARDNNKSSESVGAK